MVAEKYGMLGRDKEYSFVETLQSVGGFFVTTGLFFVLYIHWGDNDKKSPGL